MRSIRLSRVGRRRTIALAIAAGLIGCSAVDTEGPLGQTQQAVTISDGALRVAANGGSETSAGWVQAPATGPFWAIGFNDISQGIQFLGGFASAPAVSDLTGLTWRYCNFALPAPLGCGPGNGPVPPATGLFGGQPNTQTNWRGDPIISTTRLPDSVVAYTYMANDTIVPAGPPPFANANMVVTSLSFNGGQTFTRSEYVNEGQCNAGVQDQPDATFDTTVSPPRFWVVWRHNGSGGTFGACVRGGTLNTAAQRIDWDAVGPQVVPVERAFLYGVGGLSVQGADGRVTLVYNNTDHSYTCPASLGGVAWLSNSSDDGGVSWLGSRLIRETTTFPSCMASNGIANRMRSTFSFTTVANPPGPHNDYAIVTASQNVFELYESLDRGDSWQLKKTIDSTTPEEGSPNGFSRPSRFFPYLTSDAPNRLGLHFYTTDSTDRSVFPVFFGARSLTGNIWDPVHSLQSAFAITRGDANGDGLLCTPQTNECRSLGDYVGMAAKPRTGEERTFLPAWTAFPRGVTTTQGNQRVFAARVGVN